MRRQDANGAQAQNCECLGLPQLTASDESTQLSAVDVVLSSIAGKKDQSILVKERAVETLRNLAQGGSVPFLVAVMKRYMGNARIQEVFCDAMRHSVSATNESLPAIAAESGLVGVLVNVMTLHQDSILIQEHGCAALARLTSVDDTLLSAESLDVIIIAMRREIGNHLIQEHASHALRNLTQVATYMVAVIQKGGVDVIVATMRHCFDGLMIQKYGCGVLRNISCIETGRVSTIEAGGVDAVAAAMQRYPQDFQLQRDGCSVMKQLSVESRSKSLAAMRAVTAAMREHKESSDLQSEACVALIRWADEGMVEVGAIDAVVAAMQELSRDEELQFRCCFFLEMVSLDENARLMMLAVGGVESLLGVTHRHVGVLRTVHRSIRVLHQLSQVPMGKCYIRSIGGLRIVEAALRAHPNARSFQDRGKMLLARLRS